MSYRRKTIILQGIIYISLVFLLLITLIPVWLMLVNATRSTIEIQQGISLLPSTHLMENYHFLTGKGVNLWLSFFNSLFVAMASTLLSVYFSLLTAYGLSVYNFKGKRFFANFITLIVLIPMQLSIVGFYRYMAAVGLTDSYIPLVLPAIASASSAFFAKQYLESVIIRELIDAARIDGAGEFAIFHVVMMPIAVPGAMTMAIFAFIGSWNNFFNAFILISSVEKYTLPMLIQNLKSGNMYRTEFGAIYLGLAISLLPIIVIYAIFSRYIVGGIAMGSIKE